MKDKFKMLFFLTLIGEFAFSAIDEYWQVYFNENLTINTAYIISVSNLAGAVGEVVAGVLMGVIAVSVGIRWTFLISAGLIFLLF
ncbi:MAG: hypothetical protein MI740_19235, partial [Halanaerobiales bacterium]|nr:hypothetical protein [Halanaerobiales bacterium]